MTSSPARPLGQNTPASAQLRSFIERVESINARIKDEQEARTAVFAEAKAVGFSTRAIRHIVKVRKLTPQERFEWEQERDIYMHAAGLGSDAPLHNAVDLAGIDPTVREQVIKAMEPLLPTNGKGHIDLAVDGKTVRLTRDKDGKVQAEDVLDEPASSTPQIKPVKPKEPVPEVDAAGARQIGRDYRKANRPIVDNPFPYGDSRRVDFEDGWCEVDGGDGMGPKED